MTSFNSIALNGSTLSVNGTDYNLSLSQTAEATDSSLSSFKGVAAVDNGDGTISLTVGENSVVVEKYEEQPSVLQYLTFSSPSSFTLGVYDNQKYWDGTLKYSTDGTTWTTWSGTSAISSASDGTKHNLYLCGTGNTCITGVDNDGVPWVLTGSDISCHGNIETLLDYQTVENGQHPLMADYCYYYMFADCTALTTAPELPATTLTEGCYSYMFQGCTSLTTPPKLPATTLASYCYNTMFYSCTSLTTLPKLPAITLVEWCYREMFAYCTNIKLSGTQTGDYTKSYRIPTTGTGTNATRAVDGMFYRTGGAVSGTPSINKTYYTDHDPV